MVDKINKLLKEICRKLSRGNVLNYAVDIKIFQSEKLSDNDEINSINHVLGKNIVEVGGIKRSDLLELIEIAREGFEYIGDEGAYPNKNYLFTEDFNKEINQVLEQIELLFTDNLEIFVFWLKNGHPFYPVFWDYAFLIRNDQNDFIFIGSSSD